MPDSHFGNQGSGKPATNLILVGYRGTGKSTIARLLAEDLGWQAVDADAYLEEKAGRTIKSIFEQEGELSFRNLESAVLRDLACGEKKVIATGGGVILREENRRRLRQAGMVIWLQASPWVIEQRIHGDPTTLDRRPNLTVGGLAEIQELLQIREPLYSSSCDFKIATDDLCPRQIADKILGFLQPTPRK